MLRKHLPFALVLSLIIVSALVSTGLTATTFKSLTLPIANQANRVAVLSASTVCVAFDGGKILRSTDYGNNWTTVYTTSEPSIRDILEVKFRDSSNGFAVGTFDPGSGNEKASIYQTTNGGATFTEILRYNAAGDTLYGVHSTDVSHIWACGYGLGTLTTGGAVGYSTNGGVNWSAVGWNSATAGAAQDIWFIDSSNGVVVCGTPAGGSGNDYFILRTTNGGANWAAATVPAAGTGASLTAVYFVNSTTGWACGLKGKILKTTDGGATWVAQTSGTTTNLRDIFFLDANNGAVAGGEEASNVVVRYTTDGGATWTQAAPGITATDVLNGLGAADSTNSYVVGQKAGGGIGVAYKAVVDPTVSAVTQVDIPAATTVPQNFNGNIKITGTNFLATPAVACGADITVNSITVNSATQLTVNLTVAMAAAAGARTVTVTNPDTGTVSYTGFAVTALPTITSLQYNSRYQGWSGSFAVNGTGFQTGVTANFGSGISVLSSTLTGSTLVTFAIQIAPDAPAGPHQVQIINPDGGTAVSTLAIVATVNPPTLNNVKFNDIPYVPPSALYATQEINVNPSVSFDFAAPGLVSPDAFRIFVINSLGFTEIAVPVSAYVGSTTLGTVTTTIGPLTAGDQTILLTGTDQLGQGASQLCYVWVRNQSTADRTTVQPVIPYPNPWDPTVDPNVTFQMLSQADFPSSKFIILDASGQILYQQPVNIVAGQNKVVWNGNGGFGRQVPDGTFMIPVLDSTGVPKFKGKLVVRHGR